MRQLFTNLAERQAHREIKSQTHKDADRLTDKITMDREYRFYYYDTLQNIEHTSQRKQAFRLFFWADLIFWGIS